MSVRWESLAPPLRTDGSKDNQQFWRMVRAAMDPSHSCTAEFRGDNVLLVFEGSRGGPLVFSHILICSVDDGSGRALLHGNDGQAVNPPVRFAAEVR